MKKQFAALSLLLVFCLSLFCLPARAENGPDSASGLPAWYPADPKNFPFYHDEAAPRVVDSADLFTEAEEQRIEARITELRQALSWDIVIYTDKTDYGHGKDILAADFYDFNGYGYGDEREGICLFIDRDPADRGWWACCTGSRIIFGAA